METIKAIDDVVFDECEAEELIDFFANDSRTSKEIHFCNCSGRVQCHRHDWFGIEHCEVLGLEWQIPKP